MPKKAAKTLVEATKRDIDMELSYVVSRLVDPNLVPESSEAGGPFQRSLRERLLVIRSWKGSDPFFVFRDKITLHWKDRRGIWQIDELVHEEFVAAVQYGNLAKRDVAIWLLCQQCSLGLATVDTLKTLAQLPGVYKQYLKIKKQAMKATGDL